MLLIIGRIWSLRLSVSVSMFRLSEYETYLHVRPVVDADV